MGAYPYTVEANFEQGTVASEWTSESTDTNNALNIRHYTYLSRLEQSLKGPIAPFRGAYCLQIDTDGTTTHQLRHNSIDIADTEEAWIGMYLFISPDFTATANDIFNIMEVKSAGDAVERAMSLQITAATGVIQLGVGKVAGTQWSAQGLTRGKWIHVELFVSLQTVGTGVGTVYVDGVQVATITTLTDIAVTYGLLGTINLAATTTGTLFFDQFKFDVGAAAALTAFGPYKDRFPEIMYVTKTTHLCMGDSDLLNVTLLQGVGTDNALKIYDTDRASTTDEAGIVAHLYNLTASEPPIDLADVPVRVKRGAYVVLSGTSPRALVHIDRSEGYYSAGRVRHLGSRK